MRIRKLKRKLQNKQWLEQQYERLCEVNKTLHKFFMFECDKRFVGSEMAQFNLRKYNKEVKKNRRQIQFIKSFLYE